MIINLCGLIFCFSLDAHHIIVNVLLAFLYRKHEFYLQELELKHKFSPSHPMLQIKNIKNMHDDMHFINIIISNLKKSEQNQNAQKARKLQFVLNHLKVSIIQ